MAIARHLRNAPIREGLINIQHEPVSIEAIKNFSSAISDKYGTTIDIWQHAFELKVGEMELARNDRTPSGRRFDSPKVGPPHVVMAQTTSFTYSRLEPYSDWEELRDAARPMWDLFASIAKPQFVNRLAVRYVNFMNLPLQPGEEFADYLNAGPDIPEGLPQSVSAFLQRVVMVDTATNNKAVVMQAIEETSIPVGAPNVPVILDIDAFAERSSLPNDPGIWTTLDGLREYKNRIFFAHLTEKTVGIFA